MLELERANNRRGQTFLLRRLMKLVELVIELALPIWLNADATDRAVFGVGLRPLDYNNR